MFGRLPPSDRDSVAAARRRLAAIAAQFPTAEEGHPDDRLAPAPSRSDAEAEPGQTTTAAPTAEPGKHVSRADAPFASRWDLTAHHVAIVALAAVALVAVAAWLVLRSQPHSQPVQLSSERSVPSSAPTGSAVSTPTAALSGSPVLAPSQSTNAPSTSASLTSAPATTGQIIVDVAGKVRRPGIVELPAGSRVVDALDAAGGARPGVDTRSLNLARPLLDGEQIVVGYDVPSVSSPAGATSASPSSGAGAPVQQVDLNTATAEQLDTLPDIGPVTAQSILTWRQQNGSFTSVDELLEVSGIGDATLADVSPYVYV